MKKVLTLVLSAAFLLSIINSAYAGWNATVASRDQKEIWCKKHPHKCLKAEEKKKECWDLNNDGVLDKHEKIERDKHPRACPGK